MKVCLLKWLRTASLILLFYLMGGCDEVDRRLTIVNNTDKAMFYVLSTDSILDEGSPNYKKEVFKIGNAKDTVWVEQDYFVKPYSKKRNDILGGNGWTYFINRESSDSTLYVFFFNAMDLVDTPWEELRSEKKYIELHSFTVEELEKNNWKVVLENNN
ncbi:hypothetical protein H9Q13_17745 [Pontibacter sp. JH31]|uniref:Lipoprotein n=1 Tax=Pontibacter aquaedesilientis TaxID=2766980 RepID=A0ABR7XL40_9BACT|nr:hypothetical protein [Pontibacter aquaedesilientis]MBD1399017.1 hypothetical protein [Pontibacter aquaedesilientis]